MADSTSSVLASAPVPSVDLERVEKFTREPFLLEGEDASVALAEGTPRRRAFDAAMAEIEAGREHPSIAWRREYSLLLGLERLLSEEEPHLADGTTLSAHQVDALSGTLIALVAEAQGDQPRNGNGRRAIELRIRLLRKVIPSASLWEPQMWMAMPRFSSRCLSRLGQPSVQQGRSVGPMRLQGATIP